MGGSIDAVLAEAAAGCIGLSRDGELDVLRDLHTASAQLEAAKLRLIVRLTQPGVDKSFGACQIVCVSA